MIVHIWIGLAFLGGLAIGFVIGRVTKGQPGREAIAPILGTAILLVWIVGFICSITIGYSIPIGIHTVAGIAAGYFFSQDVLRRRIRNGTGGGDGNS